MTTTHHHPPHHQTHTNHHYHHYHYHPQKPAKIYYHQLICNNNNNYNHRDQHTRASRARRHGHFHHHPRKPTPGGCGGQIKHWLALIVILLALIQLVLARLDWPGDETTRAKVSENSFEEFRHHKPHVHHENHRHRQHQTPNAVNPRAGADGNFVAAAAAAGSQAKHRYGNRNEHEFSHSGESSPAAAAAAAHRRRLAQAAAAATSAGQQRSKRHNGELLNNLGGQRAGGGGNSFSPLDSAVDADRPVVATSKGLVKGITQKIFTGKFVDAFLGIPFGQPPVGKYRFRHPQPVQPWTGQLDASRMSNSCYQVNDTFFGATFGGTSIWNANTPLDENCLQLNIWTPFATANTVPGGNSSSSSGSTANRFQGSNQRGGGRPVLVWIFGGGFYSGTPTLSLYEGGAMASEEDLIVVSINYRVSALGFLYFGRPEAPGNAGLFDQLLALQWIQDEIGQFGGDPRRVTIFGESAGAVSVAFHLLSPLSRNLFSQAILQSGAATCPWGHMEANEIMANGFQLASTLGCPSANATTSDVDATIECLLRAHPMALVSQEVGQTQSSVINFPFVPVVDGAFLLEPPAESLAKGNFKPARLLLGSNNDEGNAWLIYMPEFSHCPGSTATTTQMSSSPAPESPAATSPVNATLLSQQKQQQQDDKRAKRESLPVANNNKKQAAEASLNQQTNELSKPCKPNDDLQLTRSDFIRLLRDDLNPYAEHPLGKRAIVFEYSNWINPMDPASNHDALDKIVGDYYFTCHVNEFGLRYAQAGNPVYMYYFKQRSSISPWPKWMGVIHADEINFVFGEPLNPAFNYTKKEVDLSRRIMKYWANFARFGNPTPIQGQQQQHQESQNLTAASDQWPEYLPDRRQYFELHSEYIRVGRGPRAKQCAFWSHYLPQLLRTYGKNNQCHAKFSLSSPLWSKLKSPFTGGGGARTGSGNYFGENDDDGGLQEDDKAAMSLHRPRPSRTSSGWLSSIPSFVSFSLFVIVLLAVVVLVAATGHSFYLAKADGWHLPGWLAGVWPSSWGGGAGSQPASASNNHDGHEADAGEAGDEAAPRPASSSRGGGGGGGNAAT